MKTVIDLVWISSDAHLAVLQAVYRDASLLRKLAGAFVLPDGFPYLSGFLGIPFRAPVVMYAAGRMTIEDGTLSFEATPWAPPGNTVRNLATTWKFTLAASDVTSIEAYEFKSPALGYYDMPFVRLRTAKEGNLADLLLCAGGAGPLMGSVRKRTAALGESLRAAFPAAARESQTTSGARS